MESQFVMSAAALEKFSPLDLGITSVGVFFLCVLILQEICEGENRKKKKKSNSKPYDFYFYNLSKESEGRCSMGRTSLCVWCKSSKKA